MISTCTATKILYVLPDNVSDVNCPSQPCTTLGQYLLDNGFLLPVLSDVKYYFLPGEHHVANVIDIMGALNFSWIGFGLSPAKLICWSQSYVSVFHSYNITIRNFVFDQCSGDLFYQSGIDIAAGLILYECSYCIVEDIYFSVYGFVGINLLLNSYLNNITIDMAIVKPAVQVCGTRFSLLFFNTQYDHHDHDSISINNIFISGYTKICYGHYRVMELHLNQIHYSMNVELYDSQFYNMDQIVLHVEMSHMNNSLIMRNCTFRHIKPTMGYVSQLVYGEILTNNATIWLENCSFYDNDALFLIEIIFDFFDSICAHPTNVTIKNCYFSGNNGSLLTLHNHALDCKANIFNINVNITKNMADYIMYFSQTFVYMSDVIISENKLLLEIILFEFGKVTFNKAITFLSNVCPSAIYLRSYEITYMLLMEYTKITFINNTVHHQVIRFGKTIKNSIFPYCIFQYMLSTNHKYDIAKLIKLYYVSFSDSQLHEEASSYSFDIHMNNIYDLMTHCRWLPTAVFNGSNPEYINQQIIQVNGHPWIHHKRICYCPHDGDYNCTVDILGSVSPGQLLQVDLCIPHADSSYIITIETHEVTLPNSACKLAHQTEFISTIGNNSKTFNFYYYL